GLFDTASPAEGRVSGARPRLGGKPALCADLLHHGIHELLGVDVLADAANASVLELEDEAVFVFVGLAVCDLAAIGELDDHGVSVAVGAADFALDSFGEHRADSRHELEYFVLA